MRKKFIPCLLMMLFLCGCQRTPTSPAQPVETTVPAATEPAVPEIVFASAKVNGVPAVLTVLSRDDTVDVVSSYDEKHYVVKTDLGYGLVEKNLLRMEEEGIYAPWTGFAYHGTEVYDNYRLAGKPTRILEANNAVEVLNDLGWCYLVQLEGEYGYVPIGQLAPRVVPGGVLPDSPPQSPGEDGGDIGLAFRGGVKLLAATAPQNGSISGQGMILADKTQVILAYFDAGEEIPVLKTSVDAGGETLTVYLDGLEAEIRREYLLLEGEEAETSWEGYSVYNTAVYDNFWLQGSPVDRLNGGVILTVLCEMENCYFVETEGVKGFVAKEQITDDKSKASEGAAAPNSENADGGKENAPGSGSDPEWTPPVL